MIKNLVCIIINNNKKKDMLSLTHPFNLMKYIVNFCIINYISS